MPSDSLGVLEPWLPRRLASWWLVAIRPPSCPCVAGSRFVKLSELAPKLLSCAYPKPNTVFGVLPAYH